MTGQVPDEVFFEETGYAVTAVDGAGLFDPTAHGLGPVSPHTGCWRGYVCRYAVVERGLVLRVLELGSKEEPAPLGGVQPRKGPYYRPWHYEDLDIPVAFTGRLLVGAGPADDLPRLNMGFRPAWTYRHVHELTFRAGALLTATDCSEALASVRADIAATGARPAADESTRDWISRTFSLAYDYSWPGR